MKSMKIISVSDTHLDVYKRQLVGLADAATYDDRYKKWRYEDLPILPNPFRYVVSE